MTITLACLIKASLREKKQNIQTKKPTFQSHRKKVLLYLPTTQATNFFYCHKCIHALLYEGEDKSLNNNIEFKCIKCIKKLETLWRNHSLHSMLHYEGKEVLLQETKALTFFFFFWFLTQIKFTTNILKPQITAPVTPQTPLYHTIFLQVYSK